ncbi:MAG: hypothetical protein CMI12_05900 [Oceanospirillum sp.]|nr:hypothetical protein [Oceanospirillum sp.]
MKNNKLLSLIAAVGVSALVVGCSVAPPSGKKEYIAFWEGNTQGAELEYFAKAALNQHGQDLLKAVPDDIETYCPNYYRSTYEQRLDFWAGFISSLSHFESSHQNHVWYQERFNDVQGNPVISRGLLQISIESGNGYGCGLTDQQQLHDPKTNISCGVRILNRWVGQEDKVVSGRGGWWVFGNSWKGAARYWSPFRDPNKRNRIASATRDLPYCKS